MKVVLRNVKNISDVTGAAAEESDLGCVLAVNADLGEVSYVEA